MSMQHDVQLRADARVAYEKMAVWKDQPSFEAAEARGLPLYREAVELALVDRALDREIEAVERQLRLAV